MSLRRKGSRAEPTPEVSELFKSVMAGRIEPVADYLAAGGDVDVRARNGMTLLMAAIWSEGREDIVELLLRASPDLSIREPSADWRALTYAAVNGHISILRRLLAAGDTIGPNDWKALMFAAGRGNAGNVTLLLERGADPELRNTDGRRASEIAAAAKRSALLSALGAG